MPSYAQFYTGPVPIPAPSSSHPQHTAYHSRTGKHHRHSSRSRSRSRGRRHQDKGQQHNDNNGGGSPDSSYYSASPSPPLPPLPEGMLLVLPEQPSYHQDADSSSSSSSGSSSDSDGDGCGGGGTQYYYDAESPPAIQDVEMDDWDYSSPTDGPDNVDVHDYIHDRFVNVYDPIPFDRSLARQAQTSGLLNNKHRELLDLQAKAQARLARTRARFAEGVQDAREVRQNLEWTSKKMGYLKTKASRQYGNEYRRARDRYPSPDRY